MPVRTRVSVILLFSVLLILSGCNTLKFVPEDKMLLTKVSIVDTLGKPVSGLSSYLRQKPNTKVLGFWPLQLEIYNTAPKDTTTKAKKRLQRNAFKMGEAPEIYDPTLTAASMHEIRQAMVNRGYFHCHVDTATTVKKRRVHLRYIVIPGDPYHLRSYAVDLPNNPARKVAMDGQALPEKGQKFSSSKLDDERARIASTLRNEGYYYFEKNALDYEADSSWRANEVSVTLRESNQLRDLPDSVYQQIYRPMHIRHVTFVQGKHRFLRNYRLRHTCMIKPGDLYSEKKLEQTYAAFNSLSAVKYVDIAFRPAGRDSLDCIVTLSRNKLNSVSAEVEGTYSGGDWGIAGGVEYVNKNIFHGSEQLSVGARASYEWRQNGGRAIEGRVNVGLRWPNSLKLDVTAVYQNRPDEYKRIMANAGLSYTVRHAKNSRWRHILGFVDISFIHLPWMSEQYRQQVVDRSSMLRYSYEDHLIVDWNYTGIYSGKRADQPNRSYADFRYSVETAGNTLYAISKMAHQTPDSMGVYSVFGVNYSQYVKGDIQFAYHQVLAPDHRLVYHVGFGVAVPYLNSTAVPFEKRYFAGGSNSVRGWQARTLGPGGYCGTDGQLRYDLQAGDIKLDLNLEYRWHVISILELAAFTDAGNIWTIRDYSSQPHGLFRFDSFYRQIAWSYGAGVRLDFTVLIFRVDFGVKLYDPTRLYSDGKVWRTGPNGLSWKQDCTVNFAIGYPF